MYIRRKTRSKIFTAYYSKYRVFKAEMVLNNSFAFNITNENDVRDIDGNHFNFQFQLRACNDPFVGPENTELNQKFLCSSEVLDTKCSDSIFDDVNNPSLQGEHGKGNSYIQVSLQEKFS